VKQPASGKSLKQNYIAAQGYFNHTIQVLQQDSKLDTLKLAMNVTGYKSQGAYNAQCGVFTLQQ